MLNFLSSVLGGKPVSPLTDIRSITQWMDNLPVGDGVSALAEITKQLRDYNAQDNPNDKDRLSVLMAIDEKGQASIEIVRLQYLQNPRMSRILESQLWNTVYLFYREVLQAYHTHIMNYIAHPAGSKIAAMVPMLTARTVNYFSQSIKWHYFRYAQPEAKLWKRLHNLYHFAEYEEFHCQPLRLYADTPERDIASMYAQTAMLETLNSGSLTPRQMQLIDRWLPLLVQDIELEREYKVGRHVFYVDLSQSRGARRVRRIEAGDSFRYWDSGAIKDKLDRLCAELSAGKMPAKLGLTEDCRIPACLDLLEFLSHYWAPTGVKRVQRASVRTRVIKPIEVVSGLRDIAAVVQEDTQKQLRATQAAGHDTLSYESMVDVHLYGFVTRRTQEKQELQQDMAPIHPIVPERWVMENESEGGYGATINDATNDWVRLGRLVGLRHEKTANWHVGVIRRLRQTADAQRYVGIETLSVRPLNLVLRPQASEVRPLTVDGIDPVGAVFPIPAIYIKGDADHQVQDTLVLHSAEFSTGRELWFSVRSTVYKIRLKRAVETGDDWLRVTFDVIEKTAH